MARLHIYPHSEPREDLHIIADPSALRALGNALLKAAQTPQGFERVKLHTSDGHEYTAMIVSDISEEDWQNISPPYMKSTVPSIKVLNDYHDLKVELTALKQEKL
jgi:2-C-methyl-D-erythritol 4-phosphate cytidylyltransferase